MPTTIQRIRRSQRLTESDCRQTVVKTLRGAGIYCEPIEDKVRKGIPDVYVDGGRWIECKMAVLVARGRGVNVLNFFTAHQKLRLKRDGVDQHYAAFLFCNPKMEASFFVCRFTALYSKGAMHRPEGAEPLELEDRCLWGWKKAKNWGVPLEAAPEYLLSIFGDPEHCRGLYHHDRHLNLDFANGGTTWCARSFMDRNKP